MFIKRELSGQLKEVAKEYPVVAIMGPQQSEKTTLVQVIFEYWKTLSNQPEVPRYLIYGGTQDHSISGIKILGWSSSRNLIQKIVNKK